MVRPWLALFWCTAFCSPAFSQSQTFSGEADLDAAINRAIREDKIPGAVVLVGHNGHIVYRRAYGYRALVPAKERMTADTIFDIASLTKIVATTSAAMKLVEEEKLRVDDPVTNYLPEFQGGFKSQGAGGAITVRDLMTHFSGMRPDLDLQPSWSGYETGIRKALADKPANPPEAKFTYSDINFVLVGEIVHRLSGMPENEYVKKILFQPLGMKETTYLPSAFLRPRIAPTERDERGRILRGVVDDPTARYMGGVAGHAGVFSTADDLAKFCQMILDGGDGLFDPSTIGAFTTSQSPANQPIQRGLGWDIDSPYSRPRGELFPVGSFGHTGFTGTSFWLDPASKTYVILLTNSIHPQRRPSITALRSEVATIAARSVGYGVRTGLDVLEEDGFRVFQGKRIGLITNQTGVDRMGRRNVDVMKAAGVDVVALFSPEHGIEGVEDRPGIGDAIDKKTGIKVHSLYGKTLRPTREMLRPLLAGNGALVFDIQDVGTRFYTYESTMHYAMEEAAAAKVPFYVLDRPNPITGAHVEGPMLDADKLSFTGSFPLPLRHGMTIGELAALMNAEASPKADLHVVKMIGWHRADWFDQTGLPWVNPSPNIRNLSEALLYPGIAMLEHSTNYSVGRGTEAPFEQIGADWLDPAALIARLKSMGIPAVEFEATQFRPSSSNFSGRSIAGVHFKVTDRELFNSSRLGLAVASSIQALYPGKIGLDLNRDLLGNGEVLRMLTSGGDLNAAADIGLGKFRELRQKFLNYQ